MSSACRGGGTGVIGRRPGARGAPPISREICQIEEIRHHRPNPTASKRAKGRYSVSGLDAQGGKVGTTVKRDIAEDLSEKYDIDIQDVPFGKSRSSKATTTRPSRARTPVEEEEEEAGPSTAVARTASGRKSRAQPCSKINTAPPCGAGYHEQVRPASGATCCYKDKTRASRARARAPAPSKAARRRRRGQLATSPRYSGAEVFTGASPIGPYAGIPFTSPSRRVSGSPARLPPYQTPRFANPTTAGLPDWERQEIGGTEIGAGRGYASSPETAIPLEEGRRLGGSNSHRGSSRSSSARSSPSSPFSPSPRSRVGSARNSPVNQEQALARQLQGAAQVTPSRAASYFGDF